ncbi:MAG TPA: hypothetical protein VI037_09445 [Nitrososphaera sp.]|jgi:hypothetical protein
MSGYGWNVIEYLINASGSLISGGYRRQKILKEVSGGDGLQLILHPTIKELI